MLHEDLFEQYAEALRALSSLDNLQREALRKAVERAAAGSDQAKTTMADQQRMYDRARRDADDAGRLLEELRGILRAPPVASPTAGVQLGPPATLAEIRGLIREVSDWAAETKPVAESLLRTNARLAKAAPAAGPVAEAPRRTHPVPLAAGTALVVVLLIALVVFVATR